MADAVNCGYSMTDAICWWHWLYSKGVRIGNGCAEGTVSGESDDDALWMEPWVLASWSGAWTFGSELENVSGHDLAKSSGTVARVRSALPSLSCDQRCGEAASVVAGRASGASCVRRGIRACSEDLTHSVPFGCTFRRYDPPSRPGFYKGELPAGKVDPSTGHKSKNCGWGVWANRTPEEAMNEVFSWLWKYGR